VISEIAADVDRLLPVESLQQGVQSLNDTQIVDWLGLRQVSGTHFSFTFSISK